MSASERKKRYKQTPKYKAWAKEYNAPRFCEWLLITLIPWATVSHETV